MANNSLSFSVGSHIRFDLFLTSFLKEKPKIKCGDLLDLLCQVQSDYNPFEMNSIAWEQKTIWWLALLAKHLQPSNLDRFHTFLLPLIILPTLGQNWVMIGSPCWLPGSQWIFYVQCMPLQRRDWQQMEPVSSCGWESGSIAMEASIKGSELFRVWVGQHK